ncbi:hypothetical protein TMatcc_000307 [Talaromyces marneffei ATCC 18224]
MLRVPKVVMGAEYPNPTTVSDSYRTPAFDDSTTSFHPYLLRTTPNKKVSNVLPPKKKREGKKKQPIRNIQPWKKKNKATRFNYIYRSTCMVLVLVTPEFRPGEITH